MKKITYYFLLIVLTSTYQFGCKKDNKESMYPPKTNCDTAAVTWHEDIQPIINNSCALSGCHNSQSAAGGHKLDSYNDVKESVNSNLFLAVVESGTMPKNANKLDECAIAKIRIWINNGASEH